MNIKKINILIINGPNLNLLGFRNRNIYGSKTLKEINREIKKRFAKNNMRFRFFQSNSEGKIIDAIHKYRLWADYLIINPGAYSHYSYAIRDAIESTYIKAIEVHLTDISKREKFRRKSVIKEVCLKQIKGYGYRSYIKAINFIINENKKNKSAI